MVKGTPFENHHSRERERERVLEQNCQVTDCVSLSYKKAVSGTPALCEWIKNMVRSRHKNFLTKTLPSLTRGR